MTLQPIKFSIEKEFRPSFKKMKSLDEGKKKDEYKDFQMDDSIKKLARESILMRIINVKVLDWKARLKRLGIGDEADIDIITYVVDGENDRPAYNISLKSFPKIKRQTNVAIGNPGIMIYEREGKVPRFLDIRILVARNRQGIRNVGTAMNKIVKDENFKEATFALTALLSSPINVITSQIDNIVGIIGAILEMQKDDQLLYYAATFHRDFDNLGIGKKRCDQTNYVELCYEVKAGETKGIKYG